MEEESVIRINYIFRQTGGLLSVSVPQRSMKHHERREPGETVCTRHLEVV